MTIKVDVARRLAQGQEYCASQFRGVHEISNTLVEAFLVLEVEKDTSGSDLAATDMAHMGASVLSSVSTSELHSMRVSWSVSFEIFDSEKAVTSRGEIWFHQE